MSPIYFIIHQAVNRVTMTTNIVVNIDQHLVMDDLMNAFMVCYIILFNQRPDTNAVLPVITCVITVVVICRLDDILIRFIPTFHT